MAVVRLLRWAVVAVPLADAVLALTGAVDARTAVVAGLVLEVVLGGVVAVEVLAFRRGYRRARAGGAARPAAASVGLAAALPAPVVWFLRSEAGIARALWRAVRRRRAVADGDVELPCTSRIGVLLCSLRQHPHVLRGGVLLLRFGHFRGTPVPLAGLTGARRDVRTGHAHDVEWADGALSLSVAGETSVELAFDPPVEVAVRGRPAAVTRVRFFADDPRAAARLVGERVLSDRR